MKDLEMIKKEIEEKRQYNKDCLEAWENIKRLSKKDGSDFSSLSKNFNGLKVIKEIHSLFPEERELTIYFKSNGKCESDSVSNVEMVRYSKRNVDKSRVVKEQYLEARYLLTINEIFENIECKKNQLKANIDKYTKQFENIDNKYKELKEKLSSVKSFLMIEKERDLALYYTMQELVKSELNIF